MSLAKITIHHKGHRGSVSILGGTYNTKPLDYPVGGIGDFAYALGYPLFAGGLAGTDGDIQDGTSLVLASLRPLRSSPKEAIGQLARNSTCVHTCYFSVNM